MHLAFACLACAQPRRTVIDAHITAIDCPCGWRRAIEAGGEGAPSPEAPAACLVCGCDDLWRQKDFPQGLGLAIVGAGMLLSTIAWANYRPLLAIGVLMAFALADLVLYATM